MHNCNKYSCQWVVDKWKKFAENPQTVVDNLLFKEWKLAYNPEKGFIRTNASLKPKKKAARKKTTEANVLTSAIKKSYVDWRVPVYRQNQNDKANTECSQTYLVFISLQYGSIFQIQSKIPTLPRHRGLGGWHELIEYYRPIYFGNMHIYDFKHFLKILKMSKKQNKKRPVTCNHVNLQ